MKTRLSILLLILLLCISSMPSCRGEPNYEASLGVNASDSPLQSSAIEISEDAGDSYIDSLIFVGESTTYHLKSRGVLKGGRNTDQVWAPESGTMKLDMTTKDVKIVYPKTGEKITIASASGIEKPEYMIFTFGLNGAPQNFRRGPEYFKNCYLSLINSVLDASPNTKIILQSAFPVADNMDMSNYSVDINTLNRYIRELNLWSAELAAERGFGYLNTSEVLCDEKGFLKSEFQVGDGHHLTTEAYLEILAYIRTHKYY